MKFTFGVHGCRPNGCHYPSPSRQLELFPMDAYATTSTCSGEVTIKWETHKGDDPLHIQLARHVHFTGTNETPKVSAYHGSIPEYVVPIHRLKRPLPVSGVCPCFYTSDCHFECAWHYPEATLQALLDYPYTISTDFSTYLDMPRPMQQWNIFRNKLLAAYWQIRGLLVIPSISWTTPRHIEEDLEGWPRESIIAVNSTGIGKDRRSRHNWREGYEATVALLKPTHILRYGARQEGELTDISHYYPNANRLHAILGRHGR